MSNFFQFHGTREQEPDGVRYDIHPMELVVQRVVGPSLESLALQLQTLHESQIVLIARLKVIEEKLKRSEGQLSIDVDVKMTEERLMGIKRRLTAVLSTLSTVEQRVRDKFV
jgi:hypothetical protein